MIDSSEPGLKQLSLKVRLWLWPGVVFIAAAVVSVIVYPMPTGLLLRCIVLGVTVGALWTPDLPLLSWIGLGLMVLGVPALTQLADQSARASGQVAPDWLGWQAALVSWAVVLLIAGAPTLLRRARREFRVDQ